jgi:hypothetical protein
MLRMHQRILRIQRAHCQTRICICGIIETGKVIPAMARSIPIARFNNRLHRQTSTPKESSCGWDQRSVLATAVRGYVCRNRNQIFRDILFNIPTRSGIARGILLCQLQSGDEVDYNACFSFHSFFFSPFPFAITCDLSLSLIACTEARVKSRGGGEAGRRGISLAELSSQIGR